MLSWTSRSRGDDCDSMTPPVQPLPLLQQPVRSILIAQMKFIGDLVLSSTLAENLRLEYPNARIVFVCKNGFGAFLLAHGIADEVVIFDRRLTRRRPVARFRLFLDVVKKLRRFRFDMTLDLTDSKTSRFMLGLVKAPIRVGYNPPERPLRMLERQTANVFAKPYGFGERHFLFRYLSPLEPLNIALRVRAPMLDPLSEESDKVAALLSQHDLAERGFVAVHAGAAFRGRRWQPEKFAAVIDHISERLGFPVVLVGGPDERHVADAVLAAASARVTDFVGVLSLEALLAVLHRARLFLGNESGPMHMAAAAGTPVVGLFGLTDPVRWGPVGVPHIALRPSMPCDCVVKHVCKSDDPSRAFCVWRLSIEQVIAAVDDLLAATADRSPQRRPSAGASFG